VKLPLFAAGIDMVWKVAEKSPVKAASGERAIEMARIDARQMRGKTARDHLFGKLARVPSPQRENRRHLTSRQLLFPVGSNILQKKIAENDVANPFGSRARHRLAHRLFVDFVRAWRGDRHLHQRQTGRGGLHFKQALPHGMHGHALVRAIHGRQQSYDVEFTILPRRVKRPGAVLPAAPCEPRLRPRFALRLKIVCH
jgi:hypothetical protein